MSKTQLMQIEKKILKVKTQLTKIGEMRPGSLSKQYNVCGTPGCKCKDKNNPQKHGPYYQLSYSRKGKSTSQFIRKEMVKDIEKQLKNYKKFKELTDTWIELALEHSKTKINLLKNTKE